MKIHFKWVFILIFNSSFGFSQNFKSNFFELIKVIDNREYKFSTIGDIYTEDLIKKSPYKLPMEMINYLQNRLKVNFSKGKLTTPYPLTLSLKLFSLSERVGKDKLIVGQIHFEGVYYLKNLPDSINIFPFKYSVIYKRTPRQTTQILTVLNSKMDDLNKQLENWFDIQYGVNRNLIRNVKINVVNFLPNINIDDTLFYSQRKLNLGDFTTKPKIDGRSTSNLSSKFKYTINPKLEGDTININVIVKVFEVKPDSWIIESDSLDKILQYNQIQFDITQIHAENFIMDLKKTKFNLENFDDKIGDIYENSFYSLAEIQNNIRFRNIGVWEISDQIKYANNIVIKLKKGEFNFEK